ncbi:hypothetical protein LTR10_013535 [Elasticomyces elasticus]|uniref:Defect at low temperature protein 1 n=1 Tax=Exophiala sideris TaxID=1016849 RepID=A0ABR0JPZ8_9EURO|nr:hypothetical protein LTR10_013535 [Elasticomyces elasticus]KAK5039673.1 hypothetical protein LTS07_000168 [Exophiala sideris]KAK5041225.1 hypothetical protein LTR13_002700 [Exophiala sideris]KAK5068050.1 hypothetical protein LTR69_000168 [Exophiala sideris]KAK5187352.1 hypothetical protein LTR44_000168 [Eurotiomycetes sp. CCFEE 6388]
MPRARQIVFRIFYSTSFTIVFLLLIIFICVTPADALYESYKRRRLLDIFLITGDYVVTALIASLIYASRIYTNRTVLKDIPKSFMPIEKEDLPGRRVHRLIQECMERSAVIAYQARPRSKRIEHDTIIGHTRMLALTKSRTNSIRKVEQTWGKIEHPGWSSPAGKDLPNLEYSTVIDELIDLIEAKAVSLAPIDLLEGPDPRIIDELTRPETMGMRHYLRHLIELGVVPDTSLTVAFLAAYERARYSSQPVTEDEFQALMRMFAELLRNMTPVDMEMLDLDEFDESQSATSSMHQTNPTASIASTFSDGGSVRYHGPIPRRVSEDSAPSLSSLERAYTDDETDAQSLRTAPTRATRSRSRPQIGSRRSRSNRNPSNSSESLHSTTSSRLSPHRTRTRSSNGSVIRLARPGDGHELPYTIQVPQ